MPETNKPNEHDEGAFVMHETESGTPETPAAPAARGPSSDHEAKNELVSESAPDSIDVLPEEESPAGMLPDVPEEENISEFARSVMSGLEHAGLGFDGNEKAAPKTDAGSIDLPEMAETYFAGWGGLADEEPGKIPAEPQPEPQPFSRRSFSEMGLKEGLSGPQAEPHPFNLRSLSGMGLEEGPAEPEPESEPKPFSLRSLSGMSPAAPADFHTGFSQNLSGDETKHEELADAVQSALLSVYGDPHSAGVASKTPMHAEDMHSSGRAWDTVSKPGFTTAADDKLSPQEVILNYFDYDS
ncbi:MAG: hypothetical protein HY765_00040, partial [Rhodomicrobium sp.]|nr:hypothetical protein [Rhodomicrobium sp.]